MLRAISELREQVSAIYQPSSLGVWEKKLWTTTGGHENIGDALLLQVRDILLFILNAYTAYLG